MVVVAPCFLGEGFLVRLFVPPFFFFFDSKDIRTQESIMSLPTTLKLLLATKHTDITARVKSKN